MKKHSEYCETDATLGLLYCLHCFSSIYKLIKSYGKDPIKVGTLC
jgi:hypothetical protein